MVNILEKLKILMEIQKGRESSCLKMVKYTKVIFSKGRNMDWDMRNIQISHFILVISIMEEEKEEVNFSGKMDKFTMESGKEI